MALGEMTSGSVYSISQKGAATTALIALMIIWCISVFQVHISVMVYS